MRIVLDFDGVFTDPTAEGDACAVAFQQKIMSLKLEGLTDPKDLNAWFGELRARLASKPYQFGWRSEGRISAFAFEDPFIRAIGLADFLDHLVNEKNPKAVNALSHLVHADLGTSFGDLSERCFQDLKMRKQPDHGALSWVRAQIEAGHELTIVSNSATDKIEDFLTQNAFDPIKRPKVRGGAKKFTLGAKKIPLTLLDAGVEVVIDTNRPLYEEALIAVNPDLVIGDVFSLDLACPIRLKREGKISLSHGVKYRVRDYSPTRFVDSFVDRRHTMVPELEVFRDWSKISLK